MSVVTTPCLYDPEQAGEREYPSSLAEQGRRHDMAHARLGFRPISFLLAAAVTVSAGLARAESKQRQPTVVSGSGKTVGGIFTASATGAVFELPNRALLRVAPHAAVHVFPVAQTLQLATGAKTTTWSFLLQAGRVDVEMSNSGRGAVLASMGKLSAVITKGHVTVLAKGSERVVDNTEGEVMTVLSDHWHAVPVGSLATLSHDNPSATPKPGLPAPTLDAGTRIFFASPETATLRGFHWTNVAGANRYELRFRRLADGKVIDQRSVSLPDGSDTLKAAEPGEYGLALRAVDARGLPGGWSPDAKLRVIGVVLPRGSYSTAEGVFLGPDQRVHFTNTNGLEMTYIGAGHYFPASSSVALYRNKTTVIGFRMPGSSNTATTRLEPRDIFADVQLGPMRAGPGDPISIDIRLKSASGREVPSFLRVVPKVTLGVEPLDLTFEQRGNTLHALVPPTRKTGPTVLRVDVADQFGVALGHEFLEVAPAAHGAPPAVRVVPLPKPAARPPAREPAVASSS